MLSGETSCCKKDKETDKNNLRGLYVTFVSSFKKFDFSSDGLLHFGPNTNLVKVI